MRPRALLLTLLVATGLPALVPAHADTFAVIAAGNKYVPAEVSILHGDDLQFTNLDTVPHNIVSLPARNGASFRSDTIGQGKTATVKGVKSIPPGKYDFYCSLHPTMIGELEVRNQRSTALVPMPTNVQVPTPTSVAYYKENLYIASFGANTVFKVPVLPGGQLATPEPYVTGLDVPLGIAFNTDGTLFVSDSYNSGGRRWGRVRAWPPGGGGASKGQVVIDGLPNGRHATNGLAVRNSRLFIANGNSTDDGRSGGPAEMPLSGTILSVPVKARKLSGLRPTKDLVVEARGLRNPYDIAFRPGTAELWTATNGPDRLEPYGEDLLHKFDVNQPTAVYGFPQCIYGESPRGPVAAQNPNVSARCDARRVKAPEATLGLHVSADGLAFGPRTGGWRGDLFIALYGSTDAPPRGHAILRVPIENGRAGYPEEVYTSPAPLDVAFGPAGLYVADFSSGQIVLLVAVE